MPTVVRVMLFALLLTGLCACGSNTRRDFGGGGSDAPVTILRDKPAVQLSIWEGAIVYDLRDYEAWVQGHVEGARRTTLIDLERGRDLPNDLDAPLLFMGEGPTDTRAEQAADVALSRGYANVQLFPGGWRQWIGADPMRD